MYRHVLEKSLSSVNKLFEPDAWKSNAVRWTGSLQLL